MSSAVRPAPRGTSKAADPPLLQVHDLAKHFEFRAGFFAHRTLRAVDGVSFDLHRGETLGLVGESGCGKSTVARCVLRLLLPTRGVVLFDGIHIANLDRSTMQRLRKRMQIVFQDPWGSLNPRMTVRAMVEEPLQLHTTMPRRQREERLKELMTLVGLDTVHLQRLPHQLSGGQSQRVGIARAIATNPELVVLDEPTSSLDVSVQGQILLLLQNLQQELGLSFLFVSHDLSVIRHMCRRVAVMYLGKLVEIGSTGDVLDHPQHPYTRALLSAVPSSKWGQRRERLRLKGEVPSPLDIPRGCPLSPRCPFARSACVETEPVLKTITPGHAVACYAATGWPGD
jgi:oligopeptide/dipeptide ABC transporter ATP-binding protein